MQADRNLSPAETATLLGVSVKALRLYETHGLVTPLRTVSGWRVYGPAEIAALHKVIALKRLGLSLARIAALVAGKGLALDAVLAFQEQALARDAERTRHALALVRAARAKLAHGEDLSVDDLATLTTETTMSTKMAKENWQAAFEPPIEKHFPPEKLAETTKRYFDQAKVAADWNALITEANQEMAKGDPASPVSMDIARRWSALVDQFTQGDPKLAEGARKVWADAMADPVIASKYQPQLPVSPELFAFVSKAMAAFRAKA